MSSQNAQWQWITHIWEIFLRLQFCSNCIWYYFLLQSPDRGLLLPLSHVIFPILFSLTLPQPLCSSRLVFSAHFAYLPSAHSPLLLISWLSVPSFSESCLHHHTLIRVICDPPDLPIFHLPDAFSRLLYPCPDHPGINHLSQLSKEQLEDMHGDGLVALLSPLPVGKRLGRLWRGHL